MKNRLKQAILFMGILGFVSACQYKFIIEPVDPPIDPIDTVYFAQNVLPIWNDNDNCTSCHMPNNTSPDLTSANAYSAIMQGGFVNTDDAETSGIYSFTHPDAETHGWKKYTSTEAAIVLQWIEQGAINN